MKLCFYVSVTTPLSAMVLYTLSALSTWAMKKLALDSNTPRTPGTLTIWAMSHSRSPLMAATLAFICWMPSGL